MTELDRRGFLERTAQGAAAAGLASLATHVSSAAEPVSNSPNESFIVAVMGVNGRGKGLANVFAQHADVTIAYLCDPDQNAIGPCMDQVKAKQSNKRNNPKAISDFRRALDDKTVDAVVVATPDHWHAPATVMACMAGKHVYVEKPVSHNIIEGRRMVQAARKYNKVVQAGTQRRSSPVLAEMVEFVQSGKIGDVHFCRAWITSQRPNIGYAKNEPAPKGVDYDLWLGPAPSREFNRNHFHYNWHWQWEYGTGELGNNGIHGLDVARWGLGVDHPTNVTSIGGKFFFDDDQVTPDTQTVLFEYPGKTLVWEHRTWSPHGLEGSNFGIIFYGSKGTVIVDGNGWRVEDSKAAQKDPGPKFASLDTVHQRNFLDCIKSGEKPNADIEIGHMSTTLCHLGNISQRVGRRLTWDGATESFKGDAEANELLGREYRSQWELPKV